jgi:hypothetical protein
MDVSMTEHILAVTGTVDGMVSAGVTDTFCRMQAQNSFGGIKFTTCILRDMQDYAYMRNAAAKLLFDSDCSRLWFFDNDIVPEDDILDLLDIDADIAGAAVPFESCMTGAYLRLSDLDDLESRRDPPDEGVPFSVTGLGMGCTWIRREVLEDKRMRYSSDYERRDGTIMQLQDSEPPPLFQFHRKPNGAVNMGEDFDFTYRAAKLGYSVKIVPSIVCGHIKTRDILELIQRVPRQAAA